ncbi:MAG TPA: DNA polymerase/3'-5' exonuclease PolX [Vicinamibacterales bacterium]
MENLAVARVLSEIADLLELKGENPFRVRAYRTAAQVVADHPDRVAELEPRALMDIPGIGKDLAAKIHEIAATGTTAYHQELLREFPPSILDVLRLQGIGPKTVALLYQTLRISSIEELEQAALAGAIRKIKGMGPKKEQLILTAIAERKQHAGRHLLGDTAEVAEALVAWLREAAPTATFDIVGSLRRGAETCGDIDILATGATPAIMDRFVGYRLVERILARGETKSSVLLWKGYQADLRLVQPESRGAALQYFTGSKGHNIALRQRALNRGLTLNEYGLFTLTTGERVAGDTEEGIYAALGLPWIDPALRECRGEIEAAEEGRLPQLIARGDIRGDLHMHTTESDGRHDIETMARAARALGLEYIAITEHSQLLSMANGLDDARALAHAARIREIGSRIKGIKLLAGIECDIRPDGTLDLSDETLSQLDVVIASVHSAFAQSEEEMTARILRAIENPWVDVLGHPTGRKILSREPYKVDVDRVIDAAARHGVALEINSNFHRLDLNDIHARRARDRGVPIVVNTDAHSTTELELVRWGIATARRAWLSPADVLNTRPLAELRRRLRRHRRAATVP